jgi:hypothetical protein
MLLRIVRDLTLGEVMEKIRKLEKQSGMSFEKLEELFLGKKLDANFARTYFEWSELVDSYKGYIEDGQLDYAVQEIKYLKPEQIALLTPKTIQLLYQLAIIRVESINDLAKKTGRNMKNVYGDLQVLTKLGFVKLNRCKSRALIPEMLVKEIAFLIR